MDEASCWTIEKTISTRTPSCTTTSVWPEPSDKVKEEVEQRARAVLDVREAQQGATLAEMYSPDNEAFFPDLMRAHRELDAVEAAYGVDFNGDEEKIVAHLFKLYAEKTGA